METIRLDCLFRTAQAEPVEPRPQQERSRVTQQRLLDATIDCLIKHGWSGTTTTIVAETAGVSRGAQLHHYPTKTALVLAAVDHLMQRRADEIRAANASGTRDVLDVMAATRSPDRCSVRRSRCGSRRVRTRRCGKRWCHWRPGSVATSTGSPSIC